MYKETILKISTYYQHVIDVNKKTSSKEKFSMTRRYWGVLNVFSMFHSYSERQVQKIISLVPKGAESQKGDRNANQASL